MTNVLSSVITDVETAVAPAVENSVTSAIAKEVSKLPQLVDPCLVCHGKLNGSADERVLTLPVNVSIEDSIEIVCKLFGLNTTSFTTTVDFTFGKGKINFIIFTVKWKGVQEHAKVTLALMAHADALLIPEAEFHIGA